MVSLYIAEPQRLTTIGIQASLRSIDDIVVVGECSNGTQALEEILMLKPDVALISVTLPVIDCIDLTRRLVAAQSATAVLILALQPDVHKIAEALQAGAKGWVLTQSNERQLLTAIRSVAHGALWLDPLVASEFLRGHFASLRASSVDKGESVSSAPTKEDAQVCGALTIREVQVLKLVSDGKANKQVASELSISAETVKQHIRSITRKLKVANRSQAIALAIRSHIL